MLTADPSLLDLRTNHGPYGQQPPSSFHIYTWTIGGDLSPMQVAAQFEQRDTLEAMRALAGPRQRLLAALEVGDTAAAHALLAAHPGMLDTLSDADRQVLPAAGWAANAAAVALMLELGFDPGITSEGGATALHNAAHRGAADCVRVILRHPAVTALLDLRETTYGATPLGWCVHGSGNGPRGDHATVARLLLDAGASPEVNLTDASAGVRAVIEERQGKP